MTKLATPVPELACAPAPSMTQGPSTTSHEGIQGGAALFETTAARCTDNPLGLWRRLDGAAPGRQ